MVGPTVCSPPSFRALSENLKEPAVVGVPEISPVLVFKFKPGGSEPEVILQVIGGEFAPAVNGGR